MRVGNIVMFAPGYKKHNIFKKINDDQKFVVTAVNANGIVMCTLLRPSGNISAIWAFKEDFTVIG